MPIPTAIQSWLKFLPWAAARVAPKPVASVASDWTGICRKKRIAFVQRPQIVVTWLTPCFRMLPWASSWGAMQIILGHSGILCAFPNICSTCQQDRQTGKTIIATMENNYVQYKWRETLSFQPGCSNLCRMWLLCGYCRHLVAASPARKYGLRDFSTASLSDNKSCAASSEELNVTGLVYI